MVQGSRSGFCVPSGSRVYGFWGLGFRLPKLPVSCTGACADGGAALWHLLILEGAKLLDFWTAKVLGMISSTYIEYRNQSRPGC